VSSAQVAAKAIKNLEEEDWKVLKTLETSIPRFESIPEHILQKQTGFSRHQLEFRLGRLNYQGFVMKSEHGYLMNAAGLDALALNHFANNNGISGLGRSIGMGKESDVFEVVTDTGEKAVIKFYRIGRISFRATRKMRSYTDTEKQYQWLSININAARKEAEGLVKAQKAGVSVPTFLAQNRHAVLMTEIEGDMLYKCTPDDLPQPKQTLREILENIRKAYVQGRMINCDISEYNILFDSERTWIIDWPQFVPVDHPNSSELIERDVVKTLSFFRKRFRTTIEKSEALDFVTGKNDKLRILQT
jgi:RIO kinase 2